jgi:excisionase family DNA binding protein
MATQQTDQLMTPRQVAERLGVSEGTLRVWRCNGRYPELRYIKLGSRRVRYRPEDIERFLERNTYGESA